MVCLNIDHNEIERRKQHYRNVFDYAPVDHIPICLWLAPSCGYTLREQYESTEIQFNIMVTAIERMLHLIPDDYIPFAWPTQGYMTIATMFGMDVFWSDDPNQPPGIEGHVIEDLEQVYNLRRPTMEDGIMPENIRRMRHFAENLPPDVYIQGVDTGGPLNTCKDLVDTNLLYLGFYDNPQAMYHLLDMVTEVHLELYRNLVNAAGGIDRMTTIDFGPMWAPEKYKGFLADDVCATIGPDIFEQFSIPYNNRLYSPWGSGGFHNCGPNPCKHLYLSHEPKVKYFNCSYRYSHKEFPDFKELFAGWGIVQPMFDCGETPEEMLAGFEYLMESLAPDTLGFPICIIDDSWSDSDITDFYHEMREIAEMYASKMNWRGVSA